MNIYVKRLFVPNRSRNLPMARMAFLALVLALCPSLQAQDGINSPFSQFGVGMGNLPYNMPAASAIGGVTYTRAASNMVNPFNPASYAITGKETFVFDMGLNIEFSTLRNNNKSQFDADGNLGYLAFSLPLSKWWKTAFGVMPLTDVNYMTTQKVPVEPGGIVENIYYGTGSVSRFFWGHGFNIFGANDEKKPQLRAGFNANFLYGSLTRTVTNNFEAADSTYFINKRRKKETFINNFTFDFGLQYSQPIGENHRLDAAFTMKPPQTMDIRENAVVYTYVTQSSLEYPRDTIFPVGGGDNEYTSQLEQPLTLGFGLSLQRNNRWLVAADATFAPWSGLKYTENSEFEIFGKIPLQYGKNQRYALGIQLLGDKNSTSYLRRMTFSAGAHYESGCLRLALLDGTSHTLNEWGIGAGVALPMRKGRSVLNITLAYSSFGASDLLRRDAFTVGISIGSCESWFVKRKFN